jgi:hypothetical protein
MSGGSVPANAPTDGSGPAAAILWTSRRVAIRDWLNRIAMPLAETYGGTVELFGAPIPGRGRLIAHGVREIGNGLGGFLTSPEKGVVQYRQLVDPLMKDWCAAGLPMDLATPTMLSGTAIEMDIVPISWAVMTKIIVLLVEHEAGTARAKKKFDAVYEALNAEQPSFAPLRPVVDQLANVCGWFQKRVHLNATPDSEIFTEEFRKQFEIFEELMYALSVPFFTAVDDIDAILAQANA